MTENLKLRNPWLIAVWPGMGHVALNAGIYLLSKLNMSVIAEFESSELFDVEHVEVKKGLITMAKPPRSRFFLWSDSKQERDLVVFVGEAQPPLGKYRFCQKLMAFAKDLEVNRIFTFAAMGTQMHPEHESRVFGAATDAEGVQEFRQLELEILEEGHIGGLNGILLGVAEEQGVRGACLLGEMPHIFSQFAFPKASLAILEVFKTISGVELDLSELAEQAKNVEERLGELLARVESSLTGAESEGGIDVAGEPPAQQGLGAADEERIERLFDLASQDRSKAFELKQELDRLGVFKDYEDRFLDIFKKPD